MLKQFVKEAPLGLSILLSALAIGLFVLIAPISGNKALIVRSGSMQPTINVGDLITVKPQQSYKVGDIIAFRDSAKSAVIVSHRIVSVKNQEGKVFYQTKGDANKDADFNLVPKENIIGSAQNGIRKIGRIFALAKTKNGFFAIVALPALLVILFEIHNIYREVLRTSLRSSSFDTLRTAGLKEVKKSLKHLYHHYGKPMGVPHPSASFRGIFKIPKLNLKASPRTVLPVLACFLIIGNTFSFFSDSETSTNNVFSASSQFPTPTPSPSVGNVVINEVYYDVDSEHGSEGDSQNPDEWVELYNSSSSTINIKDWSIEDNNDSDNVSSANVFIPAGGFVLIAKSNSTWSYWTEDPAADQVPIGDKIGNGLANAGDTVILKDNNGNVIDQMSWGTNTSGFSSGCTATCPKVAEGHSLERNPDGFDTNAAGDFVNRTIPTPGS